jgi:hypothetical protein
MLALSLPASVTLSVLSVLFSTVSVGCPALCSALPNAVIVLLLTAGPIAKFFSVYPHVCIPPLFFLGLGFWIDLLSIPVGF